MAKKKKTSKEVTVKNWKWGKNDKILKEYFNKNGTNNKPSNV